MWLLHSARYRQINVATHNTCIVCNILCYKRLCWRLNDRYTTCYRIDIYIVMIYDVLCMMHCRMIGNVLPTSSLKTYLIIQQLYLIRCN